MMAEQVSDIALTAGVILQENGAETYRIGTTVSAICQSYGFTAESSVISDEILLVVTQPRQEKFMSIKKAKHKHIDLYRIELVNTFSRQLKGNSLSYEEAKNELKAIEESSDFSLPVRTMAACMTGFIYTLFFGGSLWEGFVSVAVCLVTYLIIQKFSCFEIQFLKFYLSGLTIGSISILCNILIPTVNEQTIITGSIMILLPGVALTNGVKDIIYGYFSSGISKLCEALLIITAVGAGVGTILLIRK